MDSIYLDHNATTPILDCVVEAIVSTQRKYAANPASQHLAGQRARRLLEDARDRIGQHLGANTNSLQADRIILTSGGTEANNLALRGLASGRSSGQVIISAVEHPSITEPADYLQRQGSEVVRLPVSRSGVVDLGELNSLLKKPTRLVSVMLGNNETGILQPIAEIAQICLNFDVPLHTDAIQGVGKIDVNFRDMGVAAMSVSAHKFHGPCGIGALIVREDVSIEPIVFGGFQQSGIRPGTENVALTVGMERALALWRADTSGRTEHLTNCRDCLESSLREQISDMIVVGNDTDRLPHTSNVAFPGIDRQALVMALDMAGIACSTGSACASGSSEPSPVLTAMGVGPEVISSAIRLSVGATSTIAEVEEAANLISRTVNTLRTAN